jgi:hypothetical protein
VLFAKKYNFTRQLSRRGYGGFTSETKAQNWLISSKQKEFEESKKEEVKDKEIIEIEKLDIPKNSKRAKKAWVKIRRERENRAFLLELVKKHDKKGETNEETKKL